ncbi:MAG: hypothetical protein HY820_29055 [Acidobacteria bacterium]|nr:hypothetical protein [Acidobacteriota bacterium]
MDRISAPVPVHASGIRTPTVLNFPNTTQPGDPNTATLQIYSGYAVPYTLQPATQSGGAWLSVTGTQVRVTPAGLAAGTYFGGPGSLLANTSRRIPVRSSTGCPVRASAKAYAVTPNVSSINSPAGRILANSVILPAGADGSIDVVAFDATDLIVDITGYFAADDGQNGLSYYPIQQCRVSNTADNLRSRRRVTVFR